MQGVLVALVALADLLDDGVVLLTALILGVHRLLCCDLWDKRC